MTNTISGGPGGDSLNGDTNGADLNDFIDGKGGNDTCFGGFGNDTLRGGVGDDQLNGGVGNDNLDGNVGNDILRGGGGTDFVSGGDGDDLLIIGPEGGTISMFDAGAGFDVLDGSATNAMWNVQSVSGLEKVILSKFNDTWNSGPDGEILEGRDGNDAINSGGGRDSILGGDGADSLNGGEGNDTVDGGVGFDYLYLTGATGAVTANFLTHKATGMGTDSILNFEGVIGWTFDDKLVGDANANHFAGLQGNDTIDGGDGIDVAFYNSTAVGMTIDLKTGTTSGGELGVDRLLNIENVVGTNGADSINGSGDANDLFGGAGADTITGVGGNDTLYGAVGLDSIDGGAGADSLFGGLDGDVVLGGADSDQLFGEGGNDRLDGGVGVDTLLGADGADTLRGGAGGGDALGGGTGADLFTWIDADVTDAWVIVRISDFDKAADVIDLRGIDANTNKVDDQAFKVVEAFTGKQGEMVLTYDSGTNMTRVECQTDKDADIDFSLVIIGHLTDATGFVL